MRKEELICIECGKKYTLKEELKAWKDTNIGKRCQECASKLLTELVRDTVRLWKKGCFR